MSFYGESQFEEINGAKLISQDIINIVVVREVKEKYKKCKRYYKLVLIDYNFLIERLILYLYNNYSLFGNKIMIQISEKISGVPNSS